MPIAIPFLSLIIFLIFSILSSSLPSSTIFSILSSPFFYDILNSLPSSTNVLQKIICKHLIVHLVLFIYFSFFLPLLKMMRTCFSISCCSLVLYLSFQCSTPELLMLLCCYVCLYTLQYFQNNLQ
jgi:hypothetical protein